MAIQEAKDWGDLILVAQALLICGLPYRATEERQITLRYRLAGDAVSVTFTCCNPDVSMPFRFGPGPSALGDRQGDPQQTPHVSWETACEFLKDMGLSDQGKNFKDLRGRFERISSVAITVIRQRAGSTKQLIVPVIEESNLPSSVDVKAEKTGLVRRDELSSKFGFTMNRRLWEEVRNHNVPVPMELLRQNRRKGILVDCMLFLYWRSYAAKSPAVVPWSGIEEQSSSQDSNPWRKRENFDKAFKAIRLIDPAFPGKTTDEGVLVEPYTEFLPGGGDRKTIKAPK